MRKEITKVITESALESYIHGFAKLFRKNNTTLIRTIWGVCILTSIVLCFILVVSNVIDYFKFEVITKVQILPEIPATFPTVTLCNYNAFTNNYSREFNDKITANFNNTSYYGNFVLPKLVAKNLNDTEKQLLGLSIEVNIPFIHSKE